MKLERECFEKVNINTGMGNEELDCVNEGILAEPRRRCSHISLHLIFLQSAERDSEVQ